MAHDFSKFEHLAFDELMEEYDKATDISQAVPSSAPSAVDLERGNNTVWRAMPQIAQTIPGFDLTGQTGSDFIDRQVPIVVSQHQNTLNQFTTLELRDPRVRQQKMRAEAKQLGITADAYVTRKLADQAAIVIKRNALTGYNDLSEIETVMDEVGIPMFDRKMYLCSRHNQAIARDLADKNRDTRVDEAIAKSRIGGHANFELHKTDLLPRLTASAETGSITVSGAAQVHTVIAKNATTGLAAENRYQDLTVSSNANLAVGDCFTIAGVFRVNMPSKEELPVLRTFRVYEVKAGNVITTNAIVATGPYQDASAAPADGAAITILNNVTDQVSVFWQADAVEFIQASTALDELRESGVGVRTGTTEQGLTIAMLKDADILSQKVTTRFHIFFDFGVLDPNRCGIMLANQTGATN